MLEKSFGTKLPNEIYQDRVGAYGIIFDKKIM